MNEAQLAELDAGIAKIMEIADGFGLKYFPMRFEVCPSDVIYTFGAYGMPTRFSHWSFGNAKYRKVRMSHRFLPYPHTTDIFAGTWQATSRNQVEDSVEC